MSYTLQFFGGRPVLNISSCSNCFNLQMVSISQYLNPTATFLGIVLDAKLSWSVKTRCIKRLTAMRVISGSSWGANQSNLIQVYRATIRSLLDYGHEAIDMGCKHIKGRLHQDPVSSTENLLWCHECLVPASRMR